MINEYLLSIDFEYQEYCKIIDRIRKIYLSSPKYCSNAIFEFPQIRGIFYYEENLSP